MTSPLTISQRRIRSAGAYLLLSVVVFFPLAQVDPAYNWDLVGYCAAALADAGVSPEDLSHRTYAHLREGMPPHHFDEMVHADDFTRAAYTDPEVLPNLVPFYRGRYLYGLMLRGLMSAGVNVVDGTTWISRVSVLLLILVVAQWLSSSMPLRWSLCIAGGLALTLPMIQAASLATPDALSALFALLGVRLLHGSRWPGWSSLCFVAAVATRSDTVLTVLAFCAIPVTTWFSPGERYRRGVPVVVAFATVAWIRLLTEPYPFSTVMHHTFIELLTHPTEVYVASAPSVWLEAALSKGATLVVGANLAAMALTAALLWKRRLPDHDLYLLMAAWAAFIAHFLVFPAGWNRFYLVTYCVLVVVAARSAKRASDSP
jgi:hypothetical protein